MTGQKIAARIYLHWAGFWMMSILSQSVFIANIRFTLISNQIALTFLRKTK